MQIGVAAVRGYLPRLWLYREAALTRLAPITEQLIMSFIAEKVLGLAKSY